MCLSGIFLHYIRFTFANKNFWWNVSVYVPISDKGVYVYNCLKLSIHSKDKIGKTKCICGQVLHFSKKKT